MISITRMLKLTKGQGHKVKGQSQICRFKKKCLGYKSGTDDCVFIKLILRIYIHATLKVTKGQGHKVKGQCQICLNIKNKKL